jgi:hypothetical protein
MPLLVVVLALGVVSPSLAQAWLTDMDKVYKDESHCLTSADMRGKKTIRFRVSAAMR